VVRRELLLHDQQHYHNCKIKEGSRVHTGDIAAYATIVPVREVAAA
jgi:hypothetical protein